MEQKFRMSSFLILKRYTHAQRKQSNFYCQIPSALAPYADPSSLLLALGPFHFFSTCTIFIPSSSCSHLAQKLQYNENCPFTITCTLFQITNPHVMLLSIQMEVNNLLWNENGLLSVNSMLISGTILTWPTSKL